MEYEWDEAKRQANILKLGIDFVDATAMFAGRFIESEDRRRDYGEERYRAVGLLGDVLIQIADTWRGQSRRIISARRAGRNDRRAYYANDAGTSQEDEG